MNRLRYTIFGVLSLCIVFTAQAQSDMTGEEGEDGPPKMVTIDAGYSYNLRNTTQYLILFSGNKILTLENNKYRVSYDRDVFRVPSDMNLKAAYARHNSPFHRRYFGDQGGINVTPTMQTKRFKYGVQRSFLKNGGPDAAAKRKGVVYFFKGCKMIVRRKAGQWGKIKETSSVGLPCDIHAAWAEQGDKKMVLLKGDQYWTWEEDNSVTGPNDFHATYLMEEFTLAPAT